LIPREHALEGRTSGSVARHVATHAFVLENMKSTERGEAHGFTSSGGYVILGHKACRTGGVTNTECPNVTVTEKGSGGADSFRFNPKEVSDSIRNVVQDKVDAYIPSLLLHGLREGLKAIGFAIEGKATTTSSAWSRDLQEAMHTEDNAFLSYVTVTTQLHDATLPVAERVRHNLEMNDPKPALHVIFPAHNLAVPIFPGNILIFNPTVPHGCSAKLADYDNAHVNVMYMYLKSAVVGGNNNKIPMTAEARKRAERYWAGLNEGGSSQPHIHEDVSAAAAMDNASCGQDDDVQSANPLPDRTSSQSSDVRPSNPLPDRMSSQSSDVRLANPMSDRMSSQSSNVLPDRMSSQSSDVRLANPMPDRLSSQSSDVRPSNPLPDRMSSQSSDVRPSNPLSDRTSSRSSDVLPDRMSSQSSDVRPLNPLPDRMSSQRSLLGRGTSFRGSGREDDDVRHSNPLPDRMSSQSSILGRGTSSSGE
jgi:hypothetical protein